MRFNLGVGFLLFVTGTFADMVPGDYTCWNGKCAGKCNPIDGGRDGTVTDSIIHHGDNWCYLQAGRDENMVNEPRKCSPALGITTKVLVDAQVRTPNESLLVLKGYIVHGASKRSEILALAKPFLGNP
ncbi:hypothetical protein ATEIFO6365_0001111400 [Aspergillus terreus]|uniref:Uncharacterized protein n=1 Tax=Aspergillus terreus TaxID=33178 RepID=A0A5M3YN91_ASPTE|nr:hypothetical protein ATETN484_0001103500 [Aspergillus terreus]GFF12890.1 hypothetical protein ATEIFO6365_0001111400 [Aspergillus terreus]